ncbi:MAG: hypothetical protein QOI59_2231 [Gammaproteobacteria bacterium]|jgi:hypothetical protein|nr:hypothetical protein [Gammaproteobacteria bacterium]
MKDSAAGGECARQTLNEVLAAELECLRPDNKLYGTPGTERAFISIS